MSSSSLGGCGDPALTALSWGLRACSGHIPLTLVIQPSQGLFLSPFLILSSGPISSFPNSDLLCHGQQDEHRGAVDRDREEHATARPVFSAGAVRLARRDVEIAVHVPRVRKGGGLPESCVRGSGTVRDPAGEGAGTETSGARWTAWIRSP